LKISKFDKIKKLNEEINILKSHKDNIIDSNDKYLLNKYTALIHKKNIELNNITESKISNKNLGIISVFVIILFVFSLLFFNNAKTGLIVGNVSSNKTIVYIPSEAIGGNITLQFNVGDFIGVDNSIFINVTLTNTTGSTTNILNHSSMSILQFFNNASEWYCQNKSSEELIWNDVDNVRAWEGTISLGNGYNGSAGCSNIYQVNLSTFFPPFLYAPKFVSGQSFNITVNSTYFNSPSSRDTIIYKSSLLFLNRPPNMTNISILPTLPLIDDNLTANITGLGDPDENSFSGVNNVSYNWYRNNLPITVLNLPFTNNKYSIDERTSFDFSGNNLNAKIDGGNGTTYTSDNCTIGGCYRLSSYSWINISDPRNLTLGMDNFTIAFWWDPDGRNLTVLDEYYMIYKRVQNQDPSYQGIWVAVGLSSQVGANELEFQISIWNSYKNDGITFNISIPGTNNPGKKFIAITNRLTQSVNGHTVTLFINGSSESLSDLFPMEGIINNTNKDIVSYIGSGGAGSGIDDESGPYPLSINGTIDEFQIYNRTLSINQLNAIYNNGIGNYSLIVKDELKANEVWNVSAVPIDNDGLNGSRIMSNSVIPILRPVLVNPRSSKVIINPKFSMTFNFTTLEYLYLKNATIYGNWSTLVFKANNSNLSAINSNSINSINVSGIGNGTWSWNVEVCNSDHNCILNNSNFSFTANNAPNISSVSILPSSPSPTNDLIANITGLTDYDGDELVAVNNVSYNWYVNHSSITLLNLPFNDVIYGSEDNFNNMTNRTIFDFSGNNLEVNLKGIAGSLGPGNNGRFPEFFTKRCTIGGCYNFSGGSSTSSVHNFINVSDPDNITISMGKHYSILFWFNKNNKVEGTRTVYQRGTTLTPLRMTIGKTSLSTTVPYIINVLHTNNTLTQKTANYSFKGSIGNSIFIAVLYDGETGNTTLIINGTLALEAEEADKLYGAIRNESSVSSFLIGSGGTANTAIFGSIDEFQIYNRTLTSAQVAAIYNNGKGNYSVIVKEEILLGQTWNVSAVPIDYLGLNGSRSVSSSVTISNPSAIACTWSNAALNVSFGNGLSQSLSQGVVYNASKNFEGYIGSSSQNAGINWSLYNVTADNTNTADVNISIMGSHLLSGINTLGIGNITWMSNESNGNGTDASGVIRNFTYLGSSAAGQNFEGFNLTLINDGDTKLALRNRNFSNNLAPDSTSWFRFWLHVPRNTVGAKYIGNYTMECSQA